MKTFERWIDKSESCWKWLGPVDTCAVFLLQDKYVLAQVLAFELWVDSLGNKDIVSCLCGDINCTNPEHLIKTTRREAYVNGWDSAAYIKRPPAIYSFSEVVRFIKESESHGLTLAAYCREHSLDYSVVGNVKAVYREEISRSI